MITEGKSCYVCICKTTLNISSYYDNVMKYLNIYIALLIDYNMRMNLVNWKTKLFMVMPIFLRYGFSRQS